jgi:hypothetical protein
MHWLAQQPCFQRSKFVSVTTNLGSFGTSGLEGAMQGSKRVGGRQLRQCVLHAVAPAGQGRSSLQRQLVTRQCCDAVCAVHSAAVSAVHRVLVPARPPAACLPLQVVLLPAPGDHVMRYRGRWLWISRRRQSNSPLAAANVRWGWACAAPWPAAQVLMHRPRPSRQHRRNRPCPCIPRLRAGCSWRRCTSAAWAGTGACWRRCWQRPERPTRPAPGS